MYDPRFDDPGALFPELDDPGFWTQIASQVDVTYLPPTFEHRQIPRMVRCNIHGSNPGDGFGSLLSRPTWSR